MVAIVPLRRTNSQVAGDIDIISRGFVYQKENQDLIRDARKQVLMCLQGNKGPATDWGFLRKKIEGQGKGMQKSVEEEKCCTEVMIQISAIRSAINKVGGMMIEKYVMECMQNGINASLQKGEVDKSVKDVIETIVKYVK